MAVNSHQNAGIAVDLYDSLSGSFAVQETDKSGPDFQGKGRLTYANKDFLQLSGSRKYFIISGADAAENLLA
ncbi:MAG: hypothetical protein AAGA18_00380 [Verrucomicrobiota bacterium]